MGERSPEKGHGFYGTLFGKIHAVQVDLERNSLAIITAKTPYFFSTNFQRQILA